MAYDVTPVGDSEAGGATGPAPQSSTKVHTSGSLGRARVPIKRWVALAGLLAFSLVVWVGLFQVGAALIGLVSGLGAH
jgi:hypothetical protein